MQIGHQVYPFTDVVETRAQTPTKTKAINVQIGPGDIISNLPVVIDFDHHQVHEGETYRAIVADAGLDTNTDQYILVVPTYSPTIKAPHLVTTCDIYNGVAKVDIYEGSTYSSGTLVTAYNKNRNVSSTAATLVYRTVTAYSGTLIDSFYVGGGLKEAGTERNSSEWVLKSNTTYRIDLTGQAAGTDSIIGFNWYEDLGV